MRSFRVYQEGAFFVAVFGVLLVLLSTDIHAPGDPLQRAAILAGASRAEPAELELTAFVVTDSVDRKPDSPFVGTSLAIWESLDPPVKDEPRLASPALPVPDAEFLDESGDDGADEDAIRVELLNTPLSAIVIEGNNRIESDEIMKLIKTRVGQVVDSNRIRGDIRALFLSRWFYTAQVRLARSKDGTVLVISVVERPILEEGPRPE